MRSAFTKPRTCIVRSESKTHWSLRTEKKAKLKEGADVDVIVEADSSDFIKKPEN
jgi:hypothetical protein